MSRLLTIARPLRQRHVRTLLVAQTVSGLGDWAGRLALALIVFDRSDSAGWAAAVTVVSLLPWLGPGQWLATFADRLGRVRLMVATDLARAALFVLMLAPLPLTALLGLAFAAGLCVPPFSGARAATLVEVCEPDSYPSALALAGVMSQAEVLIGYAAGGVVIATVGSHVALAINAATFLVSAAMLTRLGGSAASETYAEAALGRAGLRAGLRVWRDDAICGRALLLFVGVAAFMVLPEALVVPAADALDVPSGLVGTLAALVAIGAAIGMVLAPTDGSHTELLRRTAMRGLVSSIVTAALFAAGTLPVLAAAAYVVSGMTDAVAVPTNQVVGERLPGAGRAAAMSVAGGVLNGAQVVTVALAGLAAQVLGPMAPLTLGMLVAGGFCLFAALRPVAAARAVPARELRQREPSTEPVVVG